MRTARLLTSALVLSASLGFFGAACGTFEGDENLDERVSEASDEAVVKNGITDLLDCLKTKAPTDIAGAVACIPKDCSITLTTSGSSAQPGCKLGGCNLPRVIMTCGAAPSFMPSFTLCPKSGNSNRIECGQQLAGGTNMEMCDITVPPAGGWAGLTLNDIISRPTLAADAGPDAGADIGTKGCNESGCHSTPAGGNTPNGGLPSDAFPPRPGPIINKPPLVTNDVLKDICACMRTNIVAIKAGANVAAADVDNAIKLCDALVEYTNPPPPPPPTGAGGAGSATSTSTGGTGGMGGMDMSTSTSTGGFGGMGGMDMSTSTSTGGTGGVGGMDGGMDMSTSVSTGGTGGMGGMTSTSASTGGVGGTGGVMSTSTSTGGFGTGGYGAYPQ